MIIATRRIEPEEEITYDYGPDYRYFFFNRGRCCCLSCREKAARKRKSKRVSQRERRVKRKSK